MSTSTGLTVKTNQRKIKKGCGWWVMIEKMGGLRGKPEVEDELLERSRSVAWSSWSELVFLL
jgi:hypothetical protein